MTSKRIPSIRPRRSSVELLRRRLHSPYAIRSHFHMEIVFLGMALTLVGSLGVCSLFRASGLQWVGALVAATLCGLILGFALEQAFYLRRVRRWPQVEARILRHWMKWHLDEETGAPASVYYLPVCQFRTVEGTEVIAIGGTPPDRRWPRGSTVLLHYDPQHPRTVEIVEQLGAAWFSVYLLLTLSLAFTIAFTWVCLALDA